MTETHDREPQADDVDETTPLPSDEPDALTDPEVDKIREQEDPSPGEGASPSMDAEQLRSMPPDPNPTDDDPGGFVNP